MDLLYFKVSYWSCYRNWYYEICVWYESDRTSLKRFSVDNVYLEAHELFQGKWRYITRAKCIFNEQREWGCWHDPKPSPPSWPKPKPAVLANKAQRSPSLLSSVVFDAPLGKALTSAITVQSALDEAPMS